MIEDSKKHSDAIFDTLGIISRTFESGKEGISAIGYDAMGGTSYGAYQFSSRQGTMQSFIDYLAIHAPDIALQLQNAGASNTGSTEGAMPTVWKDIALKEPQRFAMLQHSFAVEHYYTPIVSSFEQQISNHVAIQELLFSTSIQHGVKGARSIIEKALQRHKEEPEAFIRTVYSLRREQFSSSQGSVQLAVQERLLQEMERVLALYQS